MLSTLRDISLDQPDYYGENVLWLRELVEAQLSVVPTLVISNEAFRRYITSKRLDLEIIGTLLQLAETHLESPTRLFIRSSLSIQNTGVLANRVCANNGKDIESGIREIYLSWSDSKSRAYRITHSIDDSKTYPALIIQSYHHKVNSLVSRSPSTGLPTDQNNLQNVHNNVEKFQSRHEVLLNKIELTLGFPVKAYFIEGEEMLVCAVAREEMTSQARFVSMSELLRAGTIDEVQFLQSVQPNMIAEVYETEQFLSDTGGEYAVLHGIPGAPGRAIGKLIVTRREVLKEPGNSILCINEAGPNDVPFLLGSIGAIGTRGGRTSHLASISRQFEMPAVVGVTEIEIDVNAKQIQVGAKVFQERCQVLLDGYLGKVSLTEKPFTIRDIYRYRSRIDQDALEQLSSVLGKYTSDLDVFRELPLDFQLHLSSLSQKLKRIGFSPEGAPG